jgi:hypothetical protein
MEKKRLLEKGKIAKKGVSNMKKLFRVMLAVAMFVSYLPVAEAADSANLTITAGFVDLDIERINEISAELDGMPAEAEGIFNEAVTSGDIVAIKAAIGDLHGMMDHIELFLLVELNDILQRRPDLVARIDPVVVKAGDVQDVIAGYITELEALLPQLSIWSDPAGPFHVNRGETLEFKVIAEDLDTLNVNLNAISLPPGARWEPLEGQPISGPRKEGTFIWTPSFDGGNSEDITFATFEATNTESEVVTLTAEITVLPGQHLVILTNPDGPFDVRATKTLEFDVHAIDPDADVVEFYAYNIPDGATFVPVSSPDGGTVTGAFTWPTDAAVLPGSYTATFYARSYDGDYWQEAEQTELTVEITVLPAPMISIDLEGGDWQITNLAFGDKAENMSPTGEAIHRVTSRSNIIIGVDIGYMNYNTWQGYDPGGEGPGDGVFATMLCEDGYGEGVYLPVPDPIAGEDHFIPLTTNLVPDASKQVPLVLYAPTKGDPEVGLSVVLAIRAYAAE